MKKGMSLQELAIEVERVSKSKSDYIADTRSIRMLHGDHGDARQLEVVRDDEVPDGLVKLAIDEVGAFDIGETAHAQIAARLKIPLTYYRRMVDDAPALLSKNVNHWMDRDGARRMVRTLDGTARAFLSDRYRVMDNDEILMATLPVLRDLKVDVRSSSLTEKKLYLKCSFPDLQREIKGSAAKGDVVEAGFVLSNSEIGHGSINVQPMVLRLVCLNGATFNELGMRRYHVGRANGKGGNPHEFFKDDTLIADDRAFLLKLRDTITAAANETHFKMLADKMEAAADRRIEGNPVKSVEVVKKKYSLTEGEEAGMLQHLISGGDLSQWGVVNAVTRMSQDVTDYDRASDLERLGGRLVEMSGREWGEIASAA
jgi:hypothetical protein